jgi:hypothetical protein
MRIRSAALAGLVAVVVPSVTGATVGPDLKARVDAASRLHIDRELAESYPFAGCFRLASEQSGIPLIVLLGVAKGESGFNKDAVSTSSRTGEEIAHGVMQIKWPETARELGFRSKSDLYDACRNIDAGARYLRWLVDYYDGCYGHALAAYNYGPGRISLLQPLPSGADWYVRYILDKITSVSLGRHRNSDAIPFYYFSTYYRALRLQGYLERSTKLEGAEIEVQKLAFDLYAVRIRAPGPGDLEAALREIYDATGLQPMTSLSSH